MTNLKQPINFVHHVIRLLFKPQYLLTGILIPHIILTIYMIAQRMIPGGHDGFLYFVLQYYFLNHAVQYGEIPQWLPFMTQGTVAAWWYVMQASLLQNIFLLWGPFVKYIDFLFLFHSAIFFNELFLIVGTWCLSRLLYKSVYTQAVVTIIMSGSCIWMLQPHFNLHFYYALPFMLYFGHQFLKTGLWRYCFLMFHLLAIQNFGSVPYFFPVTTFVVALYFVTFIVFNFKTDKAPIHNISLNTRALWCAIGVFLSFLLVYALTTFGTDQIVQYLPGRRFDGSSSLHEFLTYAGHVNARKWVELFLWYSPAFDYSLYLGFLSVPFMCVALACNAHRSNIHILIVAVLLFLFSVGSLTATASYYIWPLMPYFRHLSLVSILVKFFLCLWIGYGVDALVEEKLHDKRRALVNTIVIISVLLSIFWAYQLNMYTISQQKLSNFIQYFMKSKGGGLPFLIDVLGTTHFVERIKIARYLVLAGGVVSGLWGMLRAKTGKKPILILIFLFIVVDMYGYKYHEIKTRMAALPETAYHELQFTDIPYQKRRSVALERSERVRVIDALVVPYAMYWINNLFLMQDEMGSTYRVSHWLKPYNQLMKAYWRQDVNDHTIPPRGHLGGKKLQLPLFHHAWGNVVGHTVDKIQFFQEAHLLSSPDQIAAMIRHPDYQGDSLLIEADNIDNQGSLDDLNRTTSLNINYRVLFFNSNRIEVAFNSENPVWMLYKDVYHPLWKANVNGVVTQVFKANLAYKAVHVPAGESKVVFDFCSPLIAFLQKLLGVISLCWVIYIFMMLSRIFCGKV